MNNGDKPINPIERGRSEQLRALVGGPAKTYYNGLTKREYAAVKAMQGLLASDSGYNTRPDAIASQAVAMADALLNELEK